MRAQEWWGLTMAAGFIPLSQRAAGQAGALGLAIILQSYLNAACFQGAVSGDVDLENTQGAGYRARET